MRDASFLHGLHVVKNHADRPERWVVTRKRGYRKWAACPCDLCRAMTHAMNAGTDAPSANRIIDKLSRKDPKP